MLRRGEAWMRDTFLFGKNWQRFLRSCVAEERVKDAANSLREFLGMPSLEGKSFLDVGAGSGLFSYAAYKLGAASIASFDADAFSVACCEYLRDHAGKPSNWTVLEGSILEESFIGQLKPADVVYAWGVLHHTGALWAALRNADRLMKPGGFLYIAIYNKTALSRFWLAEKRFYNKCPRPIRWVIECAFMMLSVAKKAVRLRNPLREIVNYGKGRRGMSWRTDITDWLGGYPYEFATAGEVFVFCRRELGLELRNLKTTNGRGNNEFLFQKPL